MIYLLSYNESFIKNLTGAMLLSTLLNIGSITAQTKAPKQKAQLTIMDVRETTDVIIEMMVSGYEEYQTVNNIAREGGPKEFMFTSSTDLKFSIALELANKGVDNKLKLLHKTRGIQHIYRYEESGAWTVVIITEVISEGDKTLYINK